MPDEILSDGAETMTEAIRFQPENLRGYNYDNLIITQHEDSNDSINFPIKDNQAFRTSILEITADDSVNLQLPAKDCFMMVLGCLLKSEKYINKNNDNELLKDQTSLVKRVLINSCKEFGFDKVEYSGENISFWETVNGTRTPFFQASTPHVFKKSFLDELSELYKNRQKPKKYTSASPDLGYESQIPTKTSSAKGTKKSSEREGCAKPRAYSVAKRAAALFESFNKELKRTRDDDFENPVHIPQANPRRRRLTSADFPTSEDDVETCRQNATSNFEPVDTTMKKGVHVDNNYKTPLPPPQTKPKRRRRRTSEDLLKSDTTVSECTSNTTVFNTSLRRSTRVRRVMPMDRMAYVAMNIQKALGKSLNEEQIQPPKRKSRGSRKEPSVKLSATLPPPKKTGRRALYSPDKWLETFRVQYSQGQ